MKTGLFFLMVLFNLTASLSYASASEGEQENPSAITSIESTRSPGDIVVIKGAGFGEYNKESFVEIGGIKAEIVITRKDQVEVKEWSDTEIEAILPVELGPGLAEVRVFNGTNKLFSPTFPIEVRSRDPVEEAIRLKGNGVSDSFIVSHLHQLAISDRRMEPDNVFGNIRLTSGDIMRLKTAGFQDDFIANFEGHPQYVSIGIAAIWLQETHDLVAAPLLRVFLVPRSFYQKQERWLREFNYLWFLPAPGPAGFFDADKWDLNFGITTRTETDGNGQDGTTEERTYLLVGFSNQLNPYALFNVGYAMATKDTKGERTQIYLGLTVDFNLLKSLGLVK